jgi:hypothetical protein
MKIAMWTNRMRFDQLEYFKETPVYKESTMKFFDIPNLLESRFFTVKESILEREDNLLMAVESLTEIEETYFDWIEQPLRTRARPEQNYHAKL